MPEISLQQAVITQDAFYIHFFVTLYLNWPTFQLCRTLLSSSGQLGSLTSFKASCATIYSP